MRVRVAENKRGSMKNETSMFSKLARRETPADRKRRRNSASCLYGGFNWLVRLRWIACAGLFFVIWFTSGVLDVVANTRPLYILGILLVAHNAVFMVISRKQPGLTDRWVFRLLFLQITIDLVILTLLLYFSGISHNPFIFYFIFHIIIAGILLPKAYAYLEAALASAMVGAVLLFQHLGYLPAHELNLPYIMGSFAGQGIYLLGKFIALASSLLLAVYFTVSVLGSVRYAEAEIRQKEKYISLGQLVSGIVHQIKNPLDGLKNCLHHIEDGCNSGKADSGQFVRLMYNELDRIEQLALRLQDYARPHGIEIKPVDVNREIAEALKLMFLKDTGGIRIQHEPGKVPEAEADPFALQEVVINLCANAIDAMPGGGNLTVQTRAASIKLGRPVGGVCIEVVDDGEGISQQEMELIFEPFYSTKPPREGTGLGLWICQMLVTQMGGYIEVESRPGSGSTFRVVLQAR
ncbi:MAG: ATP-binding protein [Gemmatimonadota bacterium]|nr:ATP-binding protein [Gemmatimonadota bacterium]